ncbi:hypothetical protein H0H81_001780 [Sphagnurus paluster]|uniref:Ph domain-containing protein n=1 Tax=Sphagnurus paluster TaxID=117069 RepID=A0A9P7FT38_9AGAR|nr:hypothetical protein H0H81_001780 [Sphagnurus paluster]
MSNVLGNAGKKLFARHVEQYAPQDPLYETYINDKGKEKRRKRALPPGLSKRDAKILKSVQRRAHYLDKGFSLCGLRFGWSFIIGLVPVLGDAADIVINYLLVVRKARQADIPSWLLQRMLFHNAVSAGVGFVPIVGDVILAVYKANSRNAALLEEFLRIRGEEFLRLQGGGTTAPDNGKKLKKTQGVANEDLAPGSGIASGEVISTIPAGARSSSPGVSSTTRKKSFGGFLSRPQETTSGNSGDDRWGAEHDGKK